MPRKLIIGTRASRLALIQTEWTRDRLAELHPELEVEVKSFSTTGDRILDIPLADIGDKALFTKELDDAMNAGEIDIAVHSLKELPSSLEPGIELIVVPQRVDPRDAWVSERYKTLDEVPEGAVVLTGSLRRRAQLLAARPDLDVKDLRGNVPTRLNKIAAEGIAGGILALAGLQRLGEGDRATSFLDPEVFVPAVGQGALGITARIGDEATAALVRPLESSDVRGAIDAERAFLAVLEGGCQAPMGCHGTVSGTTLRLRGFVASLDGTELLSTTLEGPISDAVSLGRSLGEAIQAAGGGRILGEILGDKK